LNIVVAMKQVPDLQQIRFRDRKPVWDDVPRTFGNLDKNALQAGADLKEQTGGQLIVVAAGSEELTDTIKEALAGGADEALIAADNRLEDCDGSASAAVLAALIRRLEKADLILFGEGSGDNYSGQVGSRVAEILGLPQVGYAAAIETTGGTARVTRVLEDCLEVLEVDLPAVITVVAGINEPRIPSVTQILKAGKKPKQVFGLDELEVSLPRPLTATISNLAPKMERKLIQVKSVPELLAGLQNEGLLGR